MLHVCLLRGVCAGGAVLCNGLQRRVQTHTAAAATEIATQELSFVTGEQLSGSRQHGMHAEPWLTAVLNALFGWHARRASPTHRGQQWVLPQPAHQLGA